VEDSPLLGGEEPIGKRSYICREKKHKKGKKEKIEMERELARGTSNLGRREGYVQHFEKIW